MPADHFLRAGEQRAGAGHLAQHDDLIHLVERAVDTPVTEFTIVYGVSDNDRAPVDNSAARLLGYRPKDNAEQFAVDILAAEPRQDPADLAHSRHGGPFASTPLGQGVMESMNLVDDRKKS